MCVCVKEITLKRPDIVVQLVYALTAQRCIIVFKLLFVMEVYSDLSLNSGVKAESDICPD